MDIDFEVGWKPGGPSFLELLDLTINMNPKALKWMEFDICPISIVSAR